SASGFLDTPDTIASIVPHAREYDSHDTASVYACSRSQHGINGRGILFIFCRGFEPYYNLIPHLGNNHVETAGGYKNGIGLYLFAVNSLPDIERKHPVKPLGKSLGKAGRHMLGDQNGKRKHSRQL